MSTALWSQFEGQSIDNAFRLNRLAGFGGFGAVFFADHFVEGSLMRRVAVKLIPADPDSMQRQLVELQVATGLQHPHLIKCSHAGSATFFGRSKLLYLVMEEAEEGNLQSRLAKGLLSADEVTKITTQLASALSYLHGRKLVHRDVKPANVLRVDGVWKLSDFGTVRQQAGPGTIHTDYIIGTRHYMPPESFNKMVSTAWDMWSLGVIALESLTGMQPYVESSDEEFIVAVLQKEPTIPAGLPEPLGEIVRGCLVKNHRQRWTAQQVTNALTRATWSQIKSLIATAQTHREAGRWADALNILREAEQVDPSSAEVRALIEETAKQQQDQLRKRLSELRDRAVERAGAGDFDGALRIWREVAELDPGNTAAAKGIEEIVERQRVAGLKLDIKKALDQDDYARVATLVAELPGAKPVPPPRPWTPTVPEPAVVPPCPPVRQRMPWGLILAAMLVSMIVSADFTLSSVNFRWRTPSPYWLFGGLFLAYALFQVPGGRLADRFGPRWTVTCGMIWCSAFMALPLGFLSFGKSAPVADDNSYTFLLLIALAVGIGAAVVFPALNGLIARQVPPARRGLASGIILMGFGVVPLIVTEKPRLNVGMADRWSRETLLAILGAAVALAWAWIARSVPEDGANTSRRKLPLSEMLRSRAAVAITVSFCGFGFVTYWFYPYWGRVSHWTKAPARYLFAMAICSLLGGFINDRITARFGQRAGRSITAVVGMGLAAVFFLLAWGPYEWALVWLYAGVVALGLVQSSFWSAIADLGGSSTGAVWGFVNTWGFVGLATCAWLWDQWSTRDWSGRVRPPLWLLPIVCALGAFAWLVVIAGKPKAGIASTATS